MQICGSHTRVALGLAPVGVAYAYATAAVAVEPRP